MKVHIYILFLFSLITQGLFAQKHDYNWVVGTNNEFAGNNDTFFSNSLLDFNIQPVSPQRKYLKMIMSGCSSTISDSTGNLLFFTNGDAINNFEGKLMKNGDTLSPCVVMNDYRGVGYIFPQAILALPYPNHPDQYIVIHQTPENDALFTDLYTVNVLYSIVDMSKEQGKGEVIEKNKKLIELKSGIGMLTACKHANGRDWWFLWFPYYSNLYHRFLITPNGFEPKETLTIQDSIFSNSYGYHLFTPDGTKLIKHYYGLVPSKPIVHIFDFDRCTGVLTNKKTIAMAKSEEVAYSCAISSNSRFFYAMTATRIDQLDLQANDIQKSITRVADYDGFKDLYATSFWGAQLAPDGKIYITSLSGSRYFHVIEKPDEKGLACDVRQHSFRLYGVNSGGMPNHPNYRLGPLKGSPCDSLTSIEITEEDYHIKVFPNPATTELKIDITLPNYDSQTPTEIRLVSAAGAIVKTYTMPDFAYLATLDISDVDSGFYEVQLQQKGKTMAVEKVVIMR